MKYRVHFEPEDVDADSPEQVPIIIRKRKKYGPLVRQFLQMMKDFQHKTLKLKINEYFEHLLGFQ